MLQQDALMALPHARYGDWLRILYAKMGEHVPPNANVAEIGVRPWDRGAISREVIPHAKFAAVDRDYDRARALGGWQVDILLTRVTADVILSTCILHHTAEEDIPRALANMNAPILLLSGPTADTHDPYGDHLYHLEEGQLRTWLTELGYRMTWERVGLSEPYCEALVVAKR